MQFSTKLLGFSLLAGYSLFGNDELEPMEISALRLETETKNLPARVQVIDAKKIEQSGSTDLVGLLRKEANLQVRSTSANSARSEVSMGGFGEYGHLRTLVLVDGHRVNAIDSSKINWYSIPLGLVESIEVIRGGQSGTYGNHAVGGVIKINTKLPNVKPTGSLQASAGSFDSYNMKAAYSQLVGGIGLTMFGERASSEGFRVNGGHKTDAGGLRLDWGGKSELRGYLSWSLTDSGFGLPGSLTTSQMKIDRRQANDQNNNVKEQNSWGRAGFTYEISDDWQLQTRIGLQNREVIEDTPDWGSFASKKYDSRSFSPSFNYSSKIIDFMLGFDFYEENFDSKDRLGVIEKEFKRTTTAFLATTGIHLSREWTLSGNIRTERSENSGNLNNHEDQWGGGIGLIRKFDKQDRIYGSFRRFYRYPATDEYITWGNLNPELFPENGYEIEIGTDWKIDQFSFGSRIFQQWIDGEIYYDGSRFLNVNLSKTSRIGFDATTHWQINEMVCSGINYEYVRATFEEGTNAGQKVPLVPESLLRVFLELNLADSLLLNFGASYVDESFIGGDFANIKEKLEDYWIYDLGINYELTEDATLFGGIENLLDKQYISSSNWEGTGYPGEGRKVTAGLRYSF